MGGMGAWLWDGVVGLKQGNGTAFAHMTIEPEATMFPELLQWAAGTALTPRGNVSVSWRRLAGAGDVQLNVTIPAGARATVVVPPPTVRGARGADLLESGGSLSAGKELPAGIASVEFTQAGAARIEVGSGSFCLLHRRR